MVQQQTMNPAPQAASFAPGGYRGPLGWWYRLTMPTEPASTAPISIRERFRRSRIASVLLLIFLLIAIGAVPLGLQDRPTLIAVLVALMVMIVSIILNRVGQVYIVGVILCALVVISASGILLIGPNLNANVLDIDDLQLYYILLVSVLFAAALLPSWMVFFLALINTGITIASLSLQPVTPALAAQLNSPQVGFFTLAFPAIALQWAVAGVCFLLVRSATEAIERADRAEEIVELQHREARALQLDALKDQFITSVNHELRTPIMTMQGYIELLGELQNQVDAEQRGVMLDRARAANEALVHLVQSILDTRRIDKEVEEFELQPVLLKDALVKAAELTDPNQADAPPRQLHVNVAEDIVISADPVRLQQVFTNLLSNAVKYSAPGTPVTIAARTDTQAGTSGHGRGGAKPGETAFVELTVADHGLGIPPDQIPLLFRRFVRLPRDLASRTLGTGLGLYLCRVYVEAMGGTIWVESTGVEGEGSTFYMHLPLASHNGVPAVSAPPQRDPAVNNGVHEPAVTEA